jgi:predicted dehydrogenase
MKAIIVGAGAAGILHALAYRASKVAVAAVFDPDTARALALSEACGARAVGTLEELACIDADLASVCSPPRVHVSQAEIIARAGRTVLVEKPVATSVSELDRLVALGRCVPVVQWRAGRAIRAVRRAIAHGEFGSTPAASCDLAWGRDDAYFRARGENWGCGALLSIGIHAIDALCWALGRKVEGVAGMTSSRAGITGETSVVALLRFEGGALASLRICLDGGADATRLVVCGRGVTASIEGGEGDPTATQIRWSALESATLDRLAALERDTAGALGSPLLVPYIGSVVAAVREGITVGESDRIPSIEGTYDAHAAAMCIVAYARERFDKAA